jgi:hypothetical protein
LKSTIFCDESGKVVFWNFSAVLLYDIPVFFFGLVCAIVGFYGFQRNAGGEYTILETLELIDSNFTSDVSRKKSKIYGPSKTLWPENENKLKST